MALLLHGSFEGFSNHYFVKITYHILNNKWLFSGVGHFLCFQLTTLQNCLVIFATRKWLLSSMNTCKVKSTKSHRISPTASRWNRSHSKIDVGIGPKFFSAEGGLSPTFWDLFHQKFLRCGKGPRVKNSVEKVALCKKKWMGPIPTTKNFLGPTPPH